MMETALMCMALNIFFEARSEPIQGQIAVAEVTLNRVASDDYPNTICEVVLQENSQGCQFSWWCDGKSDLPKEHNSFQTSKSLAKLMIDDGQYISVVGKNATHYHTDDIKPYWSDDMVKVEQVGKHIFYAKNTNDFKPLPRPEIIGKLYP
jgi:N-acetylmuramoyl-L-alanine amidase